METLTLGKKIQTLRKKSGMTQKQLAEAVQTSFSTFRRWEKDEHSPDTTSISKIAEILKTSAAYLLGETDNTTKINNDTTEEILKAQKLNEQTNTENVSGTTLGWADNLITIKQGNTEIRLPINEQTLPIFQKIIVKMLDNIGNAQILQNVGNGNGNQGNIGVIAEENNKK